MSSTTAPVADAEQEALHQARAAAWAKRLDEPTPESFGIQCYGDWMDYPYWVDWLSEDDEPVRFASVQDARAWLDADAACRFARDHVSWAAARARADAARDLFNRRKQCLIDNGLWTQDGEDVLPLIGKATWGLRELKQGWQDRYRVVPDADMDDPTEAVQQ